MNCEHPSFEVRARCDRLTEGEGGPVKEFRLELSVRCAHCQQIFSFPGVPLGYTSSHPTVSADGTELRAPLVPFSPFTVP